MTLTPSIRSERPTDHAAIRHLIDAAFASAAHASGAEAGIVDKLRNAGQLSLSFVAETADGIVGHIAFSPVCIGGAACGWFGLAPLSVLPAAHGQGIGRALVEAGLGALRGMGAAGCVVLGEPAYYRRFGFAVVPTIHYDGVPSEYFMALPFGKRNAAGAVRYHTAFD